MGVGQAWVTWTTDVPGDTKLDYGPDWNFGMTEYDPNPTTSHMVQLSVPVDTVFCFKASSSDGTDAAEGYNWEILPAQLADFLWPAEYERVVTGTNIQITGMVNDVYATCQSADFYVTNVQTGQQSYIGADIDGTEWLINMDIPTIDGDGWSAYWDTTGLTEGEYDLTVGMNTDIGYLQAQRRIYWDPAPPFPKINSPTFVDFVGGTVSISGDPIDAVKCDFLFEPDPNTGEYPVEPLKQRDYPFDVVEGKTMCEPTAEAAALWRRLSEKQKQKLRDAPKGAPPPGYTPDQLAIRYLVKICAHKKGTLKKGGTTRAGEERGTEKILDWLDSNWEYHPYSSGKYGSLKNKYITKGVKAIVLHIQIKGKNAHSVALKEIYDTTREEKEAKLIRVRFMDPDTGEDVNVWMDRDGNFDYPLSWTPPGKSNLAGFGTWTDVSGEGDRAPQPASAAQEGWTLIGTDTDPTDGISASWDTTGLAPGLYWIRAEAVDALGHTGWDAVEVAIPASTPKLSDCKAQPDGTPVVIPDKAITGLFGSSFWIEEDDRSSGIRATQTGDALVPGDRVAIQGFMTTNGLEREIQVSDLTIVSTGNPFPKSVGMSSRSVGGGDLGTVPLGQVGVTGGFGLNNIGLLVMTWGEVISTGNDPDLGPYADITDGSPGSPASAIRVYTGQPVSEGDFIVVTGSAGLYQDSTLRARGAVYVYSGGQP